VILHICPRAGWAAVPAGGEYRAASLDDVGFIHCSERGTVHLPADRLYAGRTDLLLLEIDPALADAELRWEPADPPAPGMPWFPHLYGPLPHAAVVAVHPFPPGVDGSFRLPEALALG
jgi:uncharacterized protein (DUF952 family)